MNLPFKPQVEVGFGSGPFDLHPEWTDITDYIWGEESGPAIETTKGRNIESNSQITVGTSSLILDNESGDFDSANPNSPFYGDLDPLVPIRIRMGNQTLFRGAVEAWPLVDSDGGPVMEVEILDAFGLLAQMEPPASAFEALSRSLKPDTWWRASDGMWIDATTGAAARHRAQYQELDAVINGEAKTWGVEEADSGSFCTDQAGLIRKNDVDGFTVTTLSLWLSPLPNGDDTANVLWQDNGIAVRVRHINENRWGIDNITFWSSLLHVEMHTPYTKVVRPGIIWSEPVLVSWTEKTFAYGEVVHLYVAIPNASMVFEESTWGVDGYRMDHPTKLYRPHLFLNAVRYETLGRALSHTLVGPPPDPTRLHLGMGALPTDSAYAGVVDHIQYFRDYISVDLLYETGRRAWAHQSLDDRLRSILEGVDADQLIGDFDESAIVTRHSYRPDPLLDLMQRIEDTEQGRIWIDRNGQIRFSNRQWPWKSIESKATFTDQIGELGPNTFMMEDLGLIRSRDSRNITTVAQVTSEFGRMQTVEAPPEIIARYGRRNAIHLSRLLHHSDEMSRSIADWIISTRSVPRTTIEQIEFYVNPTNTPLVEFAQTVEECDRITVNRLGVAVDAYVIGVRHSISTEGWRVTLNLDSTLADSNWFSWNQSQWDSSDNWIF